MKSNTILGFFIVLLVGVTSFGQNQGFNYKAIVNENGIVLQNHAIVVRFSILENGTTQVYQETHTTTTDDNGIAIVTIGEGDTSDNFSAIDWSETQYLNVAFDTGSGYVDMGTTEFKAVPFAKYANKAELADYVTYSFWNQLSNGINSNDPVGIGLSSTVEANLHIKDVTGGNPLLKMESTDNVYTIWKSNRAGVDDYLIGIDGGNNKFQFANSSTGDYPLTLHGAKVGVNNLYPTANLDVVGSIKLVDGTQGTGKVLTSDSAGNASWMEPSMPAATYEIQYSPTNAQVYNSNTSFIKTNVAFYVSETSTNPFYIPINIPVGASVTSMTYYYLDNSTTDIHFELLFSNIATGSNQSYVGASFESSGTSTEVQSQTINFSFTIAADRNYSFYVFPANGTWPSDNTLSFRGVKITYTL